jgi:hypothetical protein
MKKLAIAAACVLASGFHCDIRAADVLNGWSSASPIVRLHSEGSRTLVKLSGVTESCGHPDYWSLPLDETAKSKVKHAMLLAAYLGGKAVSLRCEGGILTDFDVLN